MWCSQYEDPNFSTQFSEYFTIYIDTWRKNWWGKNDIDVHL